MYLEVFSEQIYCVKNYLIT